MIKEKKELSLDDPETTVQHGQMILKKPFLKKIYTQWYNSFKDYTITLPDGKMLEIGSGGGFLKELIPDIITSDIMPLPGCDMTFSAEEMPLKDNEFSAIFMLNVLHHIPNCENFFKEAERMLLPGGVIYMIEPANTLFSRFIYKNFHHEPFMPESKVWQIAGTGPLSDANGAIPWLVFKRDYATFEKMYPNLKLVKFQEHTPYKYLLSGGLTMKSLVPSWGFGLIDLMEKITSPIAPFNGMFNTIIVKKISK
jgi:SAM-dependent methyltransferase